MTPERLAQIRGHIVNPASASLNRDWMLELVDELDAHLEAYRHNVAALADIGAAPFGQITVAPADAIHVTEVVMGDLKPPIIIDDRPTPPEAPRAKKGKK